MYIIEYNYKSAVFGTKKDGSTSRHTLPCENGLVVAAEMTQRNLRENSKVTNLRVYEDVTDKFMEV